ncbi:hypothetical protein GWI33_006630 [Rhynchophorus ferrugineus]|uniref:Uncharacterized protein n=1 Tax=Rhynchophorus ferrugineus TaxID=354439 RepID=A0A834IFH6_RHYFE|nr:hypothetical protein GWI33_006630 [Rhynchophorus ferrugineus]
MHFKNHHNDVIYANSSAKDYYDSEYNPLPLPVIEINEKNEQRKLKKEPLKTKAAKMINLRTVKASCTAKSAHEC